MNTVRIVLERNIFLNTPMEIEGWNYVGKQFDMDEKERSITINDEKYVLSGNDYHLCQFTHDLAIGDYVLVGNTISEILSYYTTPGSDNEYYVVAQGLHTGITYSGVPVKGLAKVKVVSEPELEVLRLKNVKGDLQIVRITKRYFYIDKINSEKDELIKVDRLVSRNRCWDTLNELGFSVMPSNENAEVILGEKELESYLKWTHCKLLGYMDDDKKGWRIMNELDSVRDFEWYLNCHGLTYCKDNLDYLNLISNRK